MTGITEWLPLEKLKVTNLDSNAILFYNIIRFKYLRLSCDQKSKEKLDKVYLNSMNKVFELYYEDRGETVPLSLKIIYFLANDFTSITLENREVLAQDESDELYEQTTTQMYELISDTSN